MVSFYAVEAEAATYVNLVLAVDESELQVLCCVSCTSPETPGPG